MRPAILVFALVPLFLGLAVTAPPAHAAARSSSASLDPDHRARCRAIAPIYTLLRSAQKSVDLVIYELEDSQATAILAADAQRGVRVRVLLDSHFVGQLQPAGLRRT